MSVGTPTVTSQGTRRAVAKPFTRSTLSRRLHCEVSLPSLAAMRAGSCFQSPARPIQSLAVCRDDDSLAC